MSRRRELISRLERAPREFTWTELVTLLERLGYTEVKRAKAGGSRRRFVHATAAMISLHEPHPGSELRACQVKLVLETLRQEGLI